MDWGTLSIQLTGDLGYSRVYISADTGIVPATGEPSAYLVTVDPDTDFSDGEVITVAVDADDRVGNPLTTAVWSFTTAPAGSQQTAILHPSGIALDSLGAAAPGPNPTIVSLRFFANARFTTKGGGARANVADNMKIGYRTDTPPPSTAPVWENYVSLTAGGYDYQRVSSATYPGPFTLADIDDLKVYVRWERDNGYLLRTTEVYAEVVYIPGN